MKRVTIDKLTLINFKGHKDRTIEFGPVTRISGRNGIGKSTLFDAFTWLLFGKDQFDRKDFEIIPTFENKRLEKVDSEVCATLIIDGRPIEIRRVLHQKWVRRRGTAEEVFDGTETLYFINGVPKKAGEYKTEIDSIIEESVFKLITNPAYFLSLHWEKQREILFRIAGTVSDYDIASQKAEFSSLLNELSGKSFADYKKELSARKKKLKDELELIPSRIDQTQRLMPENADVSALKAELETLDAEIAKIDKQLENRTEAIRDQYNAIQAKQRQINELKLQQQQLIGDEKIKAQKAASEANSSRREKEQAVKDLEQQIKRVEAERDRLCDDKDRYIKAKTELETEIEDLRKKWDLKNAEEFKASESDLICPLYNVVCKDNGAIERFNANKEQAKKNFSDKKARELDSINEDGKKISERINNAVLAIAEKEKEIASLTEKVVKLSAELEALKKELLDIPVAQVKEVVPTEMKEWVELEQKIIANQAEIDLFVPVNNEELVSKKREHNAKRDELKSKLSKQDLIVSYNAEIKTLNSRASDLAQQIADLEKSEFTMYEFEKVRIEESEKRVNRMFEIVRFKMFDYTNDGNEFTCCVATNKQGVPISATNTAEEINAGLDIINVLCEFNNVSAPIFVDRCESVNNLLSTKGQIISLVVTLEPELTIN